MHTRWAGRLIAPLAVAAFVGGARLSAFADTVTCKDGTESQSGRGACSHHGGVAATPPAASPHPSAPAAAPPARSSAPAAPRATDPAPGTRAATRSAPPPPVNGQPTAQCRDGSWSYAQHHTGACSRHGGVARWTDGTSR
jgi:Protein of unknown function (DUF3761)